MIEPTILDRAISWISPAAGARRAYARYAIETAFQAARMRRANATASDAGPNAETVSAGTALRARTRDQVRNSGFARNAKLQWSTRLWSTGMVPVWQAGKGRNKRLADAWARWAPTCWGNGPLQSGSRWEQAGLQIVGGAFESGEVLVLRRLHRAADKRPLHMTIDLLEPDYLDGSMDGRMLADGGYVLGGIEFSQNGDRRAYYLREFHPGENLIRPFSDRSKRVDAADVVHLYEPDRPGAARGVPRGHAVAERVDDLTEYLRADIMQKRVAACFAAFVSRPDADAPPLAPDAGRTPGGQRLEKINPAAIHYLGVGESVQVAAPAQAGGVRDTTQVIGREIAAGYGMPYEILSGDWSGVNYSSSRSGLIGFADEVNRYRWLVLRPALDAIVRWFLDAAYLAGILDAAPESIEWDWTEPEFRLLDRLNEAQADELELDLGTLTWAQAVAAKGYDPEVQAEEIRRWRSVREEARPATDRVSSNQNGQGKGKADPPPGPDPQPR